jgi:PadR family transcriptional regulator AphA
MLSSLSYAIMALLATKPQSGYDIARQMKPPLGLPWQAKHGQIYPELDRLVKAKLVEFVTVANKTGPPRKVHALTPAGRAELLRWVGESPRERSINDELVIKAYMLRRIPAATSVELVSEQIKVHDGRLAALESRAAALRERRETSARSASSGFGEYAALRRAIGAERDYLAWCRWLITEAAESQATQRGRPKGKARAGR